MHQEILQIIKDPNEILEPETLRQVHPEYSEADINRILALATLYKSRAFWENLYYFEDITQALNDRIPSVSQIQGCMAEEIWFSLETVHKIFPDIEYADEVIEYIKYFLNQDGVFIYPPYLPIDNPYYSKAVYLSTQGPFPLGESIEEIQAAKFLIIQEYIKTK